MESLPTALFPVFQDYLSSLSYRRFLSSCVAWKAVKRDTAYFKLSYEYSQKFLLDSSFRTKLLSRIKDKSKQIGFTKNGKTLISRVSKIEVILKELSSTLKEIKAILSGPRKDKSVEEKCIIEAMLVSFNNEMLSKGFPT
jgi:hypothetical protein